MWCVVKIVAMPGTRAAVADLCMFGLAACDDGGPGFVNAIVRTITNARQVGVRLQSKCTGTHRHARVDADNPAEKWEQTGSWVRQAARATEEQLNKDQLLLVMREQSKRTGDANRICSITHESAENKGLSLLETEMGKLLNQDEQELLSAWEGWHAPARIGMLGLTLTTQPKMVTNGVMGSPGRSSNGGTIERGSVGVGDA